MSGYSPDMSKWGRDVISSPAGKSYCEYCKEQRHNICHRQWCDCCHGTGKDKEAHLEFLQILGGGIG